MEALFFYLLKSVICLAIFGAIYHLFLRKESYFLFNRIFLLLGMVASFLFPLIQYTYTVVVQRPNWGLFLSETAVAETAVASPEPLVALGHVLLLLYIIGAVGALASVCWGVLRVLRWSRKGEKTVLRNRRVTRISAKQGSFTFLNRIFIDDSYAASDREKELILLHEEAHVSQMHWIDLLLGQALVVVQWFNPLAYLYLRSIRNNQEYLADAAVLKQDAPQALYQAALINSTLKIPVFTITNSFSSNQLNRIKMMKTKSKSKLKAFAVLLVLPALACFLWAFAEPEYVYEPIAVPEQENISPDDNPLIIIDGEVASRQTMEDIDANSIESISVLKDESAKAVYGEKGKNGVVVITSKKAGSSTESAAEQKEALTDSVKRAPVNIRVMKDDEAPQVVGTKGKAVKVFGSIRNADGSQPLYILDGKEMTEEAFQAFPHDNIESISILKDESAVKQYGEKGKNGVIIIEAKKSSSKE